MKINFCEMITLATMETKSATNVFRHDGTGGTILQNLPPENIYLTRSQHQHQGYASTSSNIIHSTNLLIAFKTQSNAHVPGKQMISWTLLPFRKQNLIMQRSRFLTLHSQCYESASAVQMVPSCCKEAWRESPTTEKKKKRPTFATKGEKRWRNYSNKVTCAQTLYPPSQLPADGLQLCKPKSGEHLLTTLSSAIRTATPALTPPQWKNFPQGL